MFYLINYVIVLFLDNDRIQFVVSSIVSVQNSEKRHVFPCLSLLCLLIRLLLWPILICQNVEEHLNLLFLREFSMNTSAIACLIKGRPKVFVAGAKEHSEATEVRDLGNYSILFFLDGQTFFSLSNSFPDSLTTCSHDPLTLLDQHMPRVLRILV